MASSAGVLCSVGEADGVAGAALAAGAVAAGATGCWAGTVVCAVAAMMAGASPWLGDAPESSREIINVETVNHLWLGLTIWPGV